MATASLPPLLRDTLQSLTDRLAVKFAGDLLEIRLFGSRARGDAREGSDVDVAIILRDGTPEETKTAINEEAWDAWRQDDEFADLAAFVLQEKHVPNPPAVREAIADGLKARGLTLEGILPMLGLLVMREDQFRRHQAGRDLLYRDLRDQGVPLWTAGTELWNEEGVPVVGRERDVRFQLDQAARDLQAAIRDQAAGDPGSAAARAYFADFHSARASLLAANIERASHGDTIGEFNRLAKAGRPLGKEFHGKLNELFKLRQDADYGNTQVREKDARRAIQTAESFVQAALEHCHRWFEQQAGLDR